MKKQLRQIDKDFDLAINIWERSITRKRRMFKPKYGKYMKEWFWEIGIDIRVVNNLPEPQRIYDMEKFVFFKLASNIQ